MRADDPGETSAVLDEAYLVNRGTDDAPASRALTLQQRLLVGGVAVEQIGRGFDVLEQELDARGIADLVSFRKRQPTRHTRSAATS